MKDKFPPRTESNSGCASHTGKCLAALKAAFPYTLPIFAGFWFLGLAYGLLMNKSGFAFYWLMVMAMTIFSGSLEFVAVGMLRSTFHPLQAFVIALLICARHLFYGISMLDKFKGLGWKKFPLIYGMCDETFSINYTAKIPEGIDRSCCLSANCSRASCSSILRRRMAWLPPHQSEMGIATVAKTIPKELSLWTIRV